MNQKIEVGSDPIVTNQAPEAVNRVDHKVIAARAYFIWVSEGYPEGRQEVHWHEAERQLLMEGSSDAGTPAGN
jgi:hypothetical protein